MKRSHKGKSRRCNATRHNRPVQRAARLVADRRAFINRARRMLLLDLLGTGSTTVDDVADAVPLPDGVDPRCLSAVASPLARLNIVRSLGPVPSVRPERRGAPVQLWVLADREKALRWLADNPDRPDPGDDGRGEAGRVPYSTAKKPQARRLPPPGVPDSGGFTCAQIPQ